MTERKLSTVRSPTSLRNMGRDWDHMEYSCFPFSEKKSQTLFFPKKLLLRLGLKLGELWLGTSFVFIGLGLELMRTERHRHVVDIDKFIVLMNNAH